MSLCYVSAFIDIGRSSWNHFARTPQTYFDHFKPFISLFKDADPTKFKMIVFIDSKYYPLIQKMDTGPIQFVSCSREYLHQHIPTWNMLPRAKEIASSEKYKEIIGKRYNVFPENTFPEYSILTNCKIDFVNRACELVETDFYCWVDFGFFKTQNTIPKNLLDIHKLDHTKMNITCLNYPDERDRDILYTIQHAPERITGAFMFGTRDQFNRFQTIHREIHQQFHDKGLIDDEQHIVLQCYFANPTFFKLHKQGWSQALLLFQL